MPLVDSYAEDIRIVDHSGYRVAALFPVGAAVDGFPRKVPRAQVDHVCIARINRARFDVLYFVIARRSYPSPGCAGVSRAERAVQLRIIASGTYDKKIGI